ncbi:MAG: nitroreductase/quinone reductase family protein [Actinobacteria bacterium]|nr:nitroreductase/quinone reductase family protein [Actinomycetota bacterium]
MWKLVGTGSRRGARPLGRAADVCRQPVLWAGFATVLSLTGPRGRRAVLRGATCSAVAGAIHLPMKLAFGRARPRGAGVLGTGRGTSSFPSGHTATDLSFVLGASQELPPLLVPLSVCTAGSHWSLMRSRIHYPSDVLAGGAIAIAVTSAASKLWPPDASRSKRPSATKRAAMRFVTNRLLNPITRPLLERGWWPRTQALIETTGRVSGQPRRVPVGNGLRDDSFWIVTEHGYAADYVKNIQRQPLRRPVNDAALLLVGTQQITIRVDLER